MGCIKSKEKEPIVLRVRGDYVDIELMYSVNGGSIKYSSLRNYDNDGGSHREQSIIL